MTAQPKNVTRTVARRSVFGGALASAVTLGTAQRASAAVVSDYILSVKETGAVGDGVADDTVAVQTAADRAVTEGKVLVFPPGVYLVEPPIVVRDATNFSIEMMGRLKRKDESSPSSLLEFVNCRNLMAGSLRVDGNAANNGKVQSDGKWYPVDEVKHDVRLDSCVGAWIGYLESSNSAADVLYLAGGEFRNADVKVDHIYATADGLTGRSVVSIIAGDNLQFGTVRSVNVGCNKGTLAMPGGFQIEPNPGDTVSNVQVDDLIVHSAGATGLGIWSPRGPEIRNVTVGSCRIHKLPGTAVNACDINIRGAVGVRIARIDHSSDPSNTNQVLSVDQSDDVQIHINVPRLGAKPVNLGYAGAVTRLRLTGSLSDASSHLLQIYNLNDSTIDMYLRNCGTSSAYVVKNSYGTSSRVRFHGDWRKGSRGAACVSGSGSLTDWFLEDVDMSGWAADTRIKYGGANYLSRIRKSRVEGLTTARAKPVYDTWGQGDFVQNVAPVVLGSAGSRYVVTGWICVTPGYALAAKWVECRAHTGT